METNLCGNCEYALKTATGAKMCVRHKRLVEDDYYACSDYYNYKKNKIYNQIKEVLKV